MKIKGKYEKKKHTDTVFKILKIEQRKQIFDLTPHGERKRVRKLSSIKLITFHTKPKTQTLLIQ